MTLLRYRLSLLLVMMAAVVAPAAFRPRFITLNESLRSMIEMLKER
ncbi:hypothetical protein [Ancylobacter radicis]|uniref:Uncharacterized protein n=1 Tax=Ancylobacter radicis TaxID=2836179 RepID=A0ABS5RC81_9HYPH|nr:hypothetical protein [Ancylobacter radicis]MBS9478531.1 hypothetical protein [Ancylobacter radicis]